MKYIIGILFFAILRFTLAQDVFSEPFELSHGNRILSGILESPSSQGKYPVAILIWGNGPHTREQKISGSPIFTQIADHLLKNGVAVMRMDKRGFGKSTGDVNGSETNYTTMDLVNDVQVALNFLKGHRLADLDRIGLIGHSEGAIIASMLASQDSFVKWQVLIAPPSVKGIEINLEQSRLNRKRLKFDSLRSAKVGEELRSYFEYVASGQKNDSIYFSIGKRFLMAHGMEKDDPGITKKFVKQLLDGYQTDWYRYFFKLDVAAYLGKTRIPTLAIFGANDTQVSVEQNVVPFHQAMKTASNTSYDVWILGDHDHFFLTYKRERIEKHVFGEMKVSQELLDLVTNWMSTKGVVKKR